MKETLITYFLVERMDKDGETELFRQPFKSRTEADNFVKQSLSSPEMQGNRFRVVSRTIKERAGEWTKEPICTTSE